MTSQYLFSLLIIVVTYKLATSGNFPWWIFLGVNLKLVCLSTPKTPWLPNSEKRGYSPIPYSRGGWKLCFKNSLCMHFWVSRHEGSSKQMMFSTNMFLNSFYTNIFVQKVPILGQNFLKNVVVRGNTNWDGRVGSWIISKV